MRTEGVIEEYIGRIHKQLYGVDARTARGVVEEIEAHIRERSRDLAEERGLDAPDEAVHRAVVEELGPSGDVAIEYLGALPKGLGTGMRLFLAIQVAIAIAALVVGLDQLGYAHDISTWPIYDQSFLASMVLVGVMLLFLGLAAAALVWKQYRRPRLVVHFGAASAVLSLALAAGLLLVMSEPIAWRHSEEVPSESAVLATVVPLFLLVAFAFVFGLRSSDDLQRRLALGELDPVELAYGRKRSRNVLGAIMVVSLVLVSSVAVGIDRYSGDIEHRDELVSTEELGNVYDAKLEHWMRSNEGVWYNDYRIYYEAGGQEYTGSYLPELRHALEWLRDGTEAGATVLCWWDYGHMVRGYAERSSVIYAPSRSLENTVADPSSVDEWEEEARVTRTAQALVATEPADTVAVMEEYGADYLLTSRRDTTGISYAFFQAAGLNILDFVTPSEGGPFERPTERGRETLVYRIWAGEEVPGLDLVYSDIDTRIYVPSG